ncbi:hypothetical protein DPEC_G00355400 [Dallia pectoralis]|uniref:Uncharacterized protein n=1 Tax=Dallia pectoralis TaxID=75939 RepID=A0ACC2EZG4_DALPE|nr:hypothetical protein DPEC_G00355400 [Dallia pectoralis]
MHDSKNWNIGDETLPNCSGISCFEDTIDASCLPMEEDPSLGHRTMEVSHTHPESVHPEPEACNDMRESSNVFLSLLERHLPKALGETLLLNGSSSSRSCTEDTRNTFSMNEGVNNAGEDDRSQDLHKDSGFCLQEGPVLQALGKTISLNGSSCSRSFLEGTHGSLEASAQSRDSFERALQNVSEEVVGPAQFQMSSVAPSGVTDANLTPVAVPDADVVASCSVPRACLESGSSFDPGCHDQKTNTMNDTFECVAEPTLEVKSGIKLTVVDFLRSSFISCGIDNRLRNGTFDACSPVRCNDNPQVGSVDNADPSSNSKTQIQADPEPTNAEVDFVAPLARSQPVSPMGHGHSNSLRNQSVDLGDQKMDTFTLDDSLELDPNILVTSTPMVASKAAGKSERTSGLVLAGRLDSVFSEQLPAASNIVTDRKLFVRPPGAVSYPKSRLPPPRTMSQLPTLAAPSKNKHANVAPAPGAVAPSLPVSAIPGKRSKTCDGPLRNVAATVSQQALADKASSIWPNTVPELNLVSTGLMKPQASVLPPGIQRSVPSLRLPTVITAARSTTKPSPSAGLNRRSLRAPGQSQKQLASSICALPVAKRKKLDCSSLATSSNADKRCGVKPATNLKAAKPTSGCANCVLLQRELEKCRQELKCWQENDTRTRDDICEKMDLKTQDNNG